MDQSTQYFSSNQNSIGAIITCNKYGFKEFKDIPQCQNDGEFVMRKFKRLGINVDESNILSNPNYEDMQQFGDRFYKQARALSQKAKEGPGGFVFLYYSGHGVQVNGRTGAVVEYKQGIPYFFDLDSLAKKLSILDKLVVITLFDCCRNKSSSVFSDNIESGQANTKSMLFQIYTTQLDIVTPIPTNALLSQGTEYFFDTVHKQYSSKIPLRELLNGIESDKSNKQNKLSMVYSKAMNSNTIELQYNDKDVTQDKKTLPYTLSQGDGQEKDIIKIYGQESFENTLLKNNKIPTITLFKRKCELQDAIELRLSEKASKNHSACVVDLIQMNESIFNKYNIQQTPTFVLYYNGESKNYSQYGSCTDQLERIVYDCESANFNLQYPKIEIITLNNIEEYKKAVQTEPVPFLLFVFSSTCPPCRKQQVELDLLAKEKHTLQTVRAFKLMTDNINVQKAIQKLEITSVPRSIIIKDRKILKQITGYQSKSQIEDLMSVCIEEGQTCPINH